MAYSSKYGFIFKRHMTPSLGTPATLEVILANSAALTVGDGVTLTSGYLAGAPIDYGILGILQGFVTSNGENIFNTKTTLKGTKSGDDTYTAASDNTSVDLVRGVVIVDQMALFQAYNDTTLTQAYVGLWFNGKVNDGTYIDGTTGTGASWSVGTQQFQLVELVTTLGDGTATTKVGLFRIGRSVLLNDVTVAAS
jgi:hypothetical protein